MKRYTQGFKYFGPMEQCNDGEWCRYEEAEEEISKVDAERIKEKIKLMASYSEKIKKLQNENKEWELAFKFMILINISIVVGIIFTDVLI